MQKVKHLFCENRGRKLAVLLLGAFGYALLTALCSQIEQFGATAWSRTLARAASCGFTAGKAGATIPSLRCSK